MHIYFCVYVYMYNVIWRHICAHIYHEYYFFAIIYTYKFKKYWTSYKMLCSFCWQECLLFLYSICYLKKNELSAQIQSALSMYNRACVTSQGKGKTLVLISVSEIELFQGRVLTKLFFHCVLIVRTFISLYRWSCIKKISA